MMAKTLFITIALLTFSVSLASGTEPDHFIPHQTFQVYPPNTLRWGGLEFLQYKWQTAMLAATPTPLDAANPNCLPYPVGGVRMLSGDLRSGDNTANPKKCRVQLFQDMLVSLNNLVGFYAFPVDLAQGYPANSMSGKIFGGVLAGACKNSTFLTIDGVNVGSIVDLSAYFKTPTPGVWSTPLSKSFLDANGGAYANLTRRTAAQAKAFGGGNYVLFRFTKIGTFRIVYGVSQQCDADLTQKTKRPFKWTYTNDNNIPNATYVYNNLTFLGAQTSPRPPASWAMDITVTF